MDLMSVFGGGGLGNGGKRRGNNTHNSKPGAAAPQMPSFGSQPSQKPGYTAKPVPEPAQAGGPPPGFTAQQWAQLQQLAQSNPSIASLLQQYLGSVGGSSGVVGAGNTGGQDWRRTLPTNTTQLLRQLSYNAGEMPMPGGYVGAVQIPAYGSSAKPVNNPDMSKYGQAPGLGEATFYQQSMQGGMTPISALKPVGVPSNWNPGGAGGNSNVLNQLQAYLNGLNNNGNANGGDWMQALTKEFRRQAKAGAGVGGVGYNMNGMLTAAILAGALGNKCGGGNGSGNGSGGGSSGDGNGWPGVGQPEPDQLGGQWRGKGTPIKLPFGF